MSISKLAEDTIADILSRLQVKSVTQLKCVCKSWCSLISSTDFVKLHMNRVVNDVSLRCNRVLLSTYPVQTIDCDNVVDSSSISLDFVSCHGLDISGEGSCIGLIICGEGSCHGLAICGEGSCHGLVCGVFDYHKIVVFNPTTRDLIELPKPSILAEQYFHYGFGYDSSTDDYKLLRIFNPNNPHYVSGRPVLAEIFSMRNNCWRRIDDILPDSGIGGVGVFLNGVLHGLTTSTTHREIVTFDLRTEQFELVPLPKAGGAIVSVGVLQDCLSVTASAIFPNLEIWVMKEYGVEDSWTKVCTILSDDDNMPIFMVPVCCTKDGEIVMDVNGRELVLYNAQESAFRKIAKGGDFDWDTCQIVVYFETLVSPRIGP